MYRLENYFLLVCLLIASVVSSLGQELPPAPGAPRPLTVPTVKEKRLANGLTVATV